MDPGRFFHTMLSKLLLVCCLALRFIECSEKPELPTSFLDRRDDKGQTEKQKTSGLLPKKISSKIEDLPHKYWKYHPFPASKIIVNARVASSAITHSRSDVCMFACINERQPDRPILIFNKTVLGGSQHCTLDEPLTSVSIVGRYILLTSGKCFSRFDKGFECASPLWYCLDEILPEDLLHKDDYIVTGKLVSESVGYLLTSIGLLICLKNIAGSRDLTFDLTVILDVINWGSENNLLALLTRKPRRLICLQGSMEVGSFRNPL